MSYKVTILGFGKIGKQIASQLLRMHSPAIDLNLMDPDISVKGAVMDLQDGIELHPQHRLDWNNQEWFENADVIFHCAGANIPPGKSRLFTAEASIQITELIFKGQRFQKQAFIIIVANPVELIAHITQSITQLPHSHIIGTGTLLDSLRMQRFVHAAFPELEKVQPILVGEHGEGVFLSREQSTINGKAFHTSINEEQMQAMMQKVKNAADEIKKTQGATIYGVSFCALKIYEALLNENKQLLPLCTSINKDLKQRLGGDQSYLSLPAILDQKGAQSLVNYPSTSDELLLLKKAQQLLDNCLPAHYR